MTVVLVTHEADIAAYADRVVTMRDGESSRTAQCQPATSAKQAGEAVVAPAAAARGGRARAQPQFLGLRADDHGRRLQALARNKMRSALTMLGVFIGVAALIAMVAVGQGANDAVRKQIESLGTNLLVVLPGATTASGVRAGFGSASTLTVSDAQAIRREATAVGEVELPHPPVRPGRSTATRTGPPASRASAPTIRRSRIGRSPPGARFQTDDEAAAALVW